MRALFSSIHHFFFQPVDARGFGLMRMAWGFTMFVYWLARWPDITRFYSNAGMLPVSLESIAMRSFLRFSLFDVLTEPTVVFGFYLLMLAGSFCCMVGIFPRISTIITTLLLFSFHERNYMLLGGGDAVLRFTGFVLMLAPGIHAYSLSRLHSQWKYWHKHHTLMPAPLMPKWPVILLTWQLVMLYFTSGWDKLQGTMWFDGSAVHVALHHLHFSRWPLWVMDGISLLALPVAWGTLLFEFLWLFMLLPSYVIREIPFLSRHLLRRLLIAGGILFHGSIFIFMDVGSFSLAMLAAYCGLLTADDFAWLERITKRVLHNTSAKPIIVLFDGQCGLCRRSIATLLTFDWLHRLHPVDFHSPERDHVAHGLSFDDLNRALHIRLPNGKTYLGFSAFRQLSWSLPPLWPLAPFLYLPGAIIIGNWLYERIANRRKRCKHENCHHLDLKPAKKALHQA